MSFFRDKLLNRYSLNIQRWKNNHRVIQLARNVNSNSSLHQLAKSSADDLFIRPVAFFNASTRIKGISLNAAFSLLACLGLQMAGLPVIRFGCKKGMSLCVLGTDRTDPSKLPPCKSCIAQSRSLYSDSLVIPFTYKINPSLTDAITNLPLEQLSEYKVIPPDKAIQSAPDSSSTFLPLGQLVLPSIRWILRRHHLQDDESTRFIYREYILSANHVAKEFSTFLDTTNPQAVILFNGQFFPEAVARWVCLQRGIRVITHEVGLQPFSAFFTTGEATAYPLHIPEDFDLDEVQNKRLDDYLSQRFQGQFSMAGIRFWPEMNGLNEAFLRHSAGFKQIVPVFTNVVFDTSQPHSNTVFPHMFAWLDLVLVIARAHPDTLFVLRAHPDETRPGKASQESVSRWVTKNQADSLPNLVFVESGQTLSSYDLIQRSKFILVYNSTIGLEASIMGFPVISAGRARYTQLPTVFFPPTPSDYLQQVNTFLDSTQISVPHEFRHNARRFLYYQLFRSSLSFSDYLEEDGIWPGFVRLKKFYPQSLTPSTSPAIKTIYQGVLKDGDFLLDSDL
jgi:Capsule polysaccharide biosynthesis protein